MGVLTELGPLIISSQEASTGGRGRTTGVQDGRRPPPALGQHQPLPPQGSAHLPGLDSMGRISGTPYPPGPLPPASVSGGPSSAYSSSSIGTASSHRHGVLSGAGSELPSTYRAVGGYGGQAGAGPGYGGRTARMVASSAMSPHVAAAEDNGSGGNLSQYGQSRFPPQGQAGGGHAAFPTPSFPSPSIAPGNQVAGAASVAATGVGKRANPEKLREIEELKQELTRASEMTEILRRQGRHLDSMQHSRYVKELQTNIQALESNLYEDSADSEESTGHGGGNVLGGSSMPAPDFGSIWSGPATSTGFGRVDSAFAHQAPGLGRMESSASAPFASFASMGSATPGLTPPVGGATMPADKFGGTLGIDGGGVPFASSLGPLRTASSASATGSEWVPTTDGIVASGPTAAAAFGRSDSTPAAAIPGVERVSSMVATPSVGFGHVDSGVGVTSAAIAGLNRVASGAPVTDAGWERPSSTVANTPARSEQPGISSSGAVHGLDRISSAPFMTWNMPLGGSNDQQEGLRIGDDGMGSMGSSTAMVAVGRPDTAASSMVSSALQRISSVSSTPWIMQPEKGDDRDGSLMGYGQKGRHDVEVPGASGTHGTATAWEHMIGSAELGGNDSTMASVAATGLTGTAGVKISMSTKLEISGDKEGSLVDYGGQGRSGDSGLGPDPDKVKAAAGMADPDLADLLEWGAAPTDTGSSSAREATVAGTSENVGLTEGSGKRDGWGPKFEDEGSDLAQSRGKQMASASTSTSVAPMGVPEGNSVSQSSVVGASELPAVPLSSLGPVTLETPVSSKVEAAGGAAPGEEAGGGGGMGAGAGVSEGTTRGPDGPKSTLNGKLAKLEEERQACRKRAAAFRKEGNMAQWREEQKKARELEKKIEDMEILGGDDEEEDEEDDLEVLLGLKKPKRSKKVGNAAANPMRAKMVEEVQALKKTALTLKREGKLAEAKGSLRDAKVKEKEIEEKDLVGGWDSGGESEDEAAQLEVLLGMRPPKGGRSQQDYASSLNIGSSDMESFGDLGLEAPGGKLDLSALGLGDLGALDVGAVSVDDSDLHDPQIAAMLKEVGWQEDSSGLSGLAELTGPSLQVERYDKGTLLREALGCKRRAQTLRRQGKMLEADEELERASAMEARIKALESRSAGYKATSLGRQPSATAGTGIPPDHYSPFREDVLSVSQEVTEEDEQNPEYLEALSEMGWEADDHLSAPSRNKPFVHGQMGRMAVGQSPDSSNLATDLVTMKQEVLSHKQRSLALKREGKIAEAKAALKEAKTLEKRIVQLEASGLAGVNRPTPSSEHVPRPASVGPLEGGDFSMWGGHGGDPEVTEKDEHDPEVIAMLQSVGWSFEEEKSATRKPPGQPKVKADARGPQSSGVVEDVRILKQEALDHKRRAVDLKRAGKLAEARQELKVAKDIENRIQQLEAVNLASNLAGGMQTLPSLNAGGDVSMLGDHAMDPNVTEEDENDPEMRAMLESVGWSFAEEKKAKRQAEGPKVHESGRGPQTTGIIGDVSILKQEALDHKRRAVALKKEGKLPQAKEELKLAKAIEKRIEELEAANLEVPTSVPPVSAAVPHAAKLVSQGGDKKEGIEDCGRRHSDSSTCDVPAMRQEALHRKRKSMALRREGKLAEAEEEVRLAKLIEKRIEELESSDMATAPSQQTPVLGVSQAAELGPRRGSGHGDGAGVAKEDTRGPEVVEVPKSGLRTIKIEETASKEVIDERKIQSIQADVVRLGEEAVAHKRRAVAFKREGNLAQAREELRAAKLLEKKVEELKALIAADHQSMPLLGGTPAAAVSAPESKDGVVMVAQGPEHSTGKKDSGGVLRPDTLCQHQIGLDVKEDGKNEADEVQTLSVNICALEQEMIKHMDRAVASRKDGLIAEAKEELKAAEMIDQRIKAMRAMKPEAVTQMLPSSGLGALSMSPELERGDCKVRADQQQDSGVPDQEERSTEKLPQLSAAGRYDEADETQKMQMTGNKEVAEDVAQGGQVVPSKTERMELWEKALAHKRHALALRKEQRLEEAEEEMRKADLFMMRVKQLELACKTEADDQGVKVKDATVVKVAEEEPASAGLCVVPHAPSHSGPYSSGEDAVEVKAAERSRPVSDAIPAVGSCEEGEDELIFSLEEEALKAKKQERKLRKQGKIEEANEVLTKLEGITENIAKLKAEMERRKSDCSRVEADVPGNSDEEDAEDLLLTLEAEVLSTKRQERTLRRQGKLEEANELLKKRKAMEDKIIKIEIDMERQKSDSGGVHGKEDRHTGSHEEDNEALILGLEEEALETKKLERELRRAGKIEAAKESVQKCEAIQEKIMEIRTEIEKQKAEGRSYGPNNLPAGSRDGDAQEKLLVALEEEALIAKWQEIALRRQGKLEEANKMVSKEAGIQEKIMTIKTEMERRKSGHVDGLEKPPVGTREDDEEDQLILALEEEAIDTRKQELALRRNGKLDEAKEVNRKYRDIQEKIVKVKMEVERRKSGSVHGREKVPAASHEHEEDEDKLILALEEEGLETKREEIALLRQGKLDEANEMSRKHTEIQEKIVKIKTKMERRREEKLRTPSREEDEEKLILVLEEEALEIKQEELMLRRQGRPVEANQVSRRYTEIQEKITKVRTDMERRKSGGVHGGEKAPKLPLQPFRPPGAQRPESNYSKADGDKHSDSPVRPSDDIRQPIVDDSKNQAAAERETATEVRKAMDLLDSKWESSMQGVESPLLPWSEGGAEMLVEEAQRLVNALSAAGGGNEALMNSVGLPQVVDHCEGSEERKSEEGSSDSIHCNSSMKAAGVKLEIAKEGSSPHGKEEDVEEVLWQRLEQHRRKSMVLHEEGKTQEAEEELQSVERIKQQMEALLVGGMTGDGVGEEKSDKRTSLGPGELQTDRNGKAGGGYHTSSGQSRDSYFSLHVLSDAGDVPVPAAATGNEYEQAGKGGGVGSAVVSSAGKGGNFRWAESIVSAPWGKGEKEQYLKWLKDDLVEIERRAMAFESQGRKEDALREWVKGRAVENRIRELEGGTWRPVVVPDREQVAPLQGLSWKREEPKNAHDDIPHGLGTESQSGTVGSTQIFGKERRRSEQEDEIDGEPEVDDACNVEEERMGKKERARELEALEKERRHLLLETNRQRTAGKSEEASALYAKAKQIKAQIQALTEQGKSSGSLSEGTTSTETPQDTGKHDHGVPPRAVETSSKISDEVGSDGQGDTQYSDRSREETTRNETSTSSSELEFLRGEKKRLVNLSLTLKREGKTREAAIEYSKLKEVSARIQALKEQEKSGGVLTPDTQHSDPGREETTRDEMSSELEFLQGEKKRLLNLSLTLKREGKIREAAVEYSKLKEVSARIQTLKEQEKSGGVLTPGPDVSAAPSRMSTVRPPVSPRQPSPRQSPTGRRPSQRPVSPLQAPQQPNASGGGGPIPPPPDVSSAPPSRMPAGGRSPRPVSPRQPSPRPSPPIQLPPLNTSWGIRPPSSASSSDSEPKPGTGPLRSGKGSDGSGQNFATPLPPARLSELGGSSWELKPPGAGISPRPVQSGGSLNPGDNGDREGSEGRRTPTGTGWGPPPPANRWGAPGASPPGWRQDSMGFNVPPPPPPTSIRPGASKSPPPAVPKPPTPAPASPSPRMPPKSPPREQQQCRAKARIMAPMGRR
ncbi:hypothetical protein CBR_g52260 [Chara braunii]|uniref:Uncharacterized protein n=1 Tax=Chara braunii TaxID=69332 RepID=A0A388MA57_CHABU|nr:hypothetical protein CBR_g52260 [Chara braunii]|eukprot:GBG91373.1 hypothetical protein CBR_g52260 [Chara braunii]